SSASCPTGTRPRAAAPTANSQAVEELALRALLARSPEHDRERADDQYEVESQTPLIDVPEIEPHPVVERHPVPAAADLPETGETGPHGEPAKIPRFAGWRARISLVPGCKRT